MKLTHSMAYKTRKFIAAVTNVHHRILSWARSSQFSSQTPTSRRSNIVLPTTSRSSQWSPSIRPSNQDRIFVFSPSEIHGLPTLVVAISLLLQQLMNRTVCGVFHYAVSFILQSSRPVSLSQNLIIKHM